MLFERLHLMYKRANPMSLMKYKHCIELFKLYNSENATDDWLDLNDQQNFNDRNDFVYQFNNLRLKIGKNKLVNRLPIITGLLKHDWMNLSLNSFKVRCKNFLLMN